MNFYKQLTSPASPVSVAFGKTRAIFIPVIEVPVSFKNETRVINSLVKQAKTAFDNGADGIFLIGGRNTDLPIYRAFEKVYNNLQETNEYKDKWIGINDRCAPNITFNKHGLGKAYKRLLPKIKGLWFDNIGLKETITTDRGKKKTTLDSSRFEENVTVITASGFTGLLMGGVNFKGQAQIKDPKVLTNAMTMASATFQVILTSGPATGSQAKPKDTQALSKLKGSASLGLASGVKSGNVGNYLEDVAIFLVRSSISKGDKLEASKIHDLRKEIC